MRRLHLIEIHEQPWCPAGVRNGATDCLNLIANVGQQYRRVLPLIGEALSATQSRRVIDLCSGGGGPWFSLARQLERMHSGPLQILLTDWYPSETAARIAKGMWSWRLEYLTTPVDATCVPPELTGFRTLFTAFHHFPPQKAQSILQNAVLNRQGIGIFEQTRRTPIACLLMLTLPVIALLTTPFMRPFRWSRLFWTYIVPAIPFVLCFDGIVSCLRTYSVDELQGLIAGLKGEEYCWEVGHLPSPLSPIGVTYAIGYPAANSAAEG
jgi:hypothetical protein